MSEITLAVIVGIDVSKDRLDVASGSTGEIWSVENNLEGVSCLKEKLLALQPERIVLESTGGYENLVLAELSGAGLRIARVNPGRVREFAKSIGQLAKTDHLDARLLVRFGEAVHPEVTILPTEGTQKLVALVNRRRQLIEMHVAEQNRLPTAPQSMSDRIQNHLDWLKTEIDELEKEVDELVQSTPALKEKDDLLRSVPGVGKITAFTLLAEIPELGSRDRKEIAALAGLAPFNQDSGHHTGKRHIHGGRPVVRNILYMATLTAVRWNPIICPFYERLRKAGKLPKVALVACMRKLLTILNAILRTHSLWKAPSKSIPAS